jgi:hypothetical protein
MQTWIQEPPSQALVAICDLDASMTNLCASLFADEDLVPTSASERRKKLQEQARKLSVVKTLPNVSREVRAEALFWCAETYLKLGDQRTAYRMFKELTWDYPDTKWCRRIHRLSDPALSWAERTSVTNAANAITSSNAPSPAVRSR